MNRTLARDITILLVITAVMLLAVTLRAQGASGGGGVGVITLRDRAEVSIDQVMLGDVAALDEVSREWAGVVVSAGQGATVTVTLDDVRRALDERGVHWGHLTLRGYRTCTVTRVGGAAVAPAAAVTRAAAPVAIADHAGDDAPMLANPGGEADVRRGTLHDVVLDRIAALAGCPREELVVELSEADRTLLSVPVVGARFEIEPLSGTGLGLVPVTIRRYRVQTGVTETLRVRPMVARRMLAAVLVTDMSKGQTFAPADVTVREVLIDSPHGVPLTDADAVIGQTASALLREGTVLYAEHLRSPVLVKRGQLVTVRALAGGLVIRTVCRASEDGTLGDAIKVRNERSREDVVVRVTGPQEAAVELDLSVSGASSQGGA